MARRLSRPTKSSAVKKLTIISVMVACSPTSSAARSAQGDSTGGKIFIKTNMMHGGDGAGDHKGDDGGAHDLTGSLAALHIGNGTGDGSKHQGHHDAEHQVDEHLAQEGDIVAAGRAEPAQQGTGYHAAQQNDRKR